MTIRRYPLVQQVADVLRTRIRNQEWPIGSKIPSENDLAGELEVGRSTVREAIRQLVGSGMLSARQGAGVFVVSFDEVVDWATTLRRSAVADVIEARNAIEVEAARLAATRRTESDLKSLERALTARQGVSSRKREDVVDADLAFHVATVAAAQNPVLTELFSTFVPRLRQAMLDYLDVLDLPAVSSSFAGGEHDALFQAIWDKDSVQAAQVSRDYLERMLHQLTSRSK